MAIIKIIIPGPPVSKPRMTQRDRWKQRPCVMRYRNWCDHAREIVGKQIPPTGDILELNWVAYFAPPKSWSKNKRLATVGQLHRQKPDRDNIDKAVLDCLFKEDSGVAVGRIEKRWGNSPRLEIEIVT